MAGSSDESEAVTAGGISGSTDRRYRRTAVGLAALGLAAGIGAALVASPTLRDLLVAFAGVGLFGGVLLYWLRPAATADVDPPERVYAALAATGEALVRDLDLADRHVYTPTDADESGFAPVYLVVPAREAGSVTSGTGRRPVLGRAALEAASDSASPVRPVTDGATGEREAADGSDDFGVALYPTGAALFAAYETILDEQLVSDPVELADQLATGVVAGLELAEAVDATVDPTDGVATVTVRGPRFGALPRFDHPVSSFLAVGFVVGMNVPVTVDAESLAGAGAYRLVCEWPTDDAEAVDGAE